MGPMKELIMDGESGVAKSEKCKTYLLRKGIKYVPRARGQQVPHIDRRGEMVRQQIHKIITQLETEGIAMPFKQILNEAVFAGNALVSVNGSTPYNAVYGRVPHLLPDELADNTDPTTRNVHRLREMSVQKMVEGTAKARAQRAIKTRAVRDAVQEDFQVGDQVDYFREPSTKDASGWHGPCTVVSVENLQRGNITIKNI